MGSRILFDASSTNPVSGIIAIAPGDCVQINAWNLNVGEVAEVFRLLIAPGSLPQATQGSCFPLLPITPADVLQEDAYVPCNQSVQVGQTTTQNITTIVLSQPGFYNLHLTPAALGTAFVEAIALTGEEACAQAAAACCCTPTLRWAGTSASPCLSITPGGPVGNEPVFDLDPCCVLQQIVNPVIPNVADSIIVLQGGACGRATLQEVIDLVMVCGTLAGFPLQAFAPLDSVIAIDAGANCKRLDLAAAVTGLETPWTGTSNNPNLTITPGGVNGHAPVFDYDLCADLQAFPSCGCEPLPGDGVPIIQGGACVMATWPTVDLCAQIAVLANGALVAGDTIPVREAGGACKQVLASTIASGFDGGVINNPILAADGSCASPTYSFQSSSDSGMWYDAGAGAVTISDDNCDDFIQIGASINITSTSSNITVSATSGVLTALASSLFAATAAGMTFIAASGNISATATSGNVNLVASATDVTVDAAQSFTVTTAATLRFTIDFTGAWQLAGAPGVAAQVLTSNGPGVTPTWQAAGGGGVAEPITQIVYGTGPAVDSSAFFFYDIATGRFGLNETSGPSRLSLAAPLDVVLASATNTIGVGKSMTMVAGDSTADNGGQVFINGGETSESVFLNRRGGNVNIRGGQPAGGFQHGGGHVLIHGGNASVSSQFGGDVIINYGTEGITATQNSSTIFLGRAGGGGGDGGLNIPANPGQLTTLRGTTGRPWLQTGSTLVLQGGSADTSGGAANGGDVRILTGEQAGGGVKGRIDFFADQGAFDSPIAHFTGSGDMVMAGYGQGTNGTQDTALLAAATTGFLWPPRIAGAPVGVPAGTNIPGGTVYANPMVVRETGGTIVLHIYEFGTATWRSVVLA